MTLHMETTRIPAAKTVGQIMALLGGSGFVRDVQVRYRDAEVYAVAFIAEVNGQPVPYVLPARAEAVQAYLQRKRSPRSRARLLEADGDQARRIAWRQVLRWIQAQLALIEVGMIEPHEAFMGYAMLPGSTTMGAWFAGAIAQGGIARVRLPSPVDAPPGE